MTERCPNVLDGVISYTSVVAIRNIQAAYKAKKIHASNEHELRIIDVIATDLDWADNKRDQRVPFATAQEKVRKLIRAAPKGYDGGLAAFLQQQSEFSQDTTLDVKALSEAIFPAVAVSVLDMGEEADSFGCALRSAKNYSRRR